MLLPVTVSTATTVQIVPTKPHATMTTTGWPNNAMEHFLQEIHDALETCLAVPSLLSLSRGLQAELRQHMISSPQCMLPSFNYTLPSGQEQGTYLAVEVGGSNLRVALVELRGRSQGPGCLQIRRAITSPITSEVKQARGHVFFDWMVDKIHDVLVLDEGLRDNIEPIRMGVAWSFPIE